MRAVDEDLRHGVSTRRFRHGLPVNRSASISSSFHCTPFPRGASSPGAERHRSDTAASASASRPDKLSAIAASRR
jgi:hypothetical protein